MHNDSTKIAQLTAILLTGGSWDLHRNSAGEKVVHEALLQDASLRQARAFSPDGSVDRFQSIHDMIALLGRHGPRDQELADALDAQRRLARRIGCVRHLLYDQTRMIDPIGVVSITPSRTSQQDHCATIEPPGG